MAGNIGAISACDKRVTYSKNVWTTQKCGSTDKTSSGAMSQFVDPANHNWRLKSSSPAIDAADPANAPATDRDGFARDALPDAGAYEYAASRPGDPNPTPTPTVTATPTSS